MLRKPTPFFFEHGPNAVILLHAFASNSNDMRLLARFLEKLDYTVYAPIFTGHATAEPKDILLEGSPEKWWQDTQDAIEHVLAHGYQKITIFGLSLGGIFATKALENDQRLLGGGVFSSPIISIGKTNVPTEFPKMAAAVYDQQQVAPAQKEMDLDWLKQHINDHLKDINQYTTEVAQQLGQIKTPFFIGQGGADEMISSDSGERLKQTLEQNGQVVDYHFYEGASHVITVNKAHRQLEEDVANYLENIFN
ncbi:alpha/beta hydrolase [Paucilactobacillus sp. N302-9]